ncbi:hypothetical protein [Nostoc punctiforme]|uniref:hypothetical protein n=1 Tax=Nostoc punctiforme TaxID=272131 RepID=UPI0005A0D97E|nr:hypothetical protein [Nostoc punctiforme]
MKSKNSTPNTLFDGKKAEIQSLSAFRKDFPDTVKSQIHKPCRDAALLRLYILLVISFIA